MKKKIISCTLIILLIVSIAIMNKERIVKLDNILVNSTNLKKYFYKDTSEDIEEVEGVEEVCPEGGGATIYYNANGGKLKNQSTNYCGGCGIDVELEIPTKEGYQFAGWYLNGRLVTNDNVETFIYQQYGSCLIPTDITLEAKWMPEPTVEVEIVCPVGGGSTIYYNANGGTLKNETTSFCSGCGTRVVLEIPTKKGYQFVGWYLNGQLVTNENVYNYLYGDVGGCHVPINITLEAEWVSEPVVEIVCPVGGGTTITYNANGGVVKNETESYCPGCGTTPELEPATRTGYIFEGWYYNDQLVTKANLRNFVETQDEYGCTRYNAITLVAKWTEGEVITITGEVTIPGGESHACAMGLGTTITYDPNGGVAKKESENYIPSIIKYPQFEEATRDGYIFLGWYYNDQLVTKNNVRTFIEYKDEYGCQAFRPITVVAKWGNKAFVLTLENDDEVYETRNIEKNSKIGILPKPYKYGYTFQGWYTEKINGTKVSDNGLYDFNANKTIYAHWLKQIAKEPVAGTATIPVISNEITVSEYINNTGNTGAVIKDITGKIKTEVSVLATGDEVTLNGQVFHIVIQGDISSDGKISTADYVRLWNHLDRANSNKITNTYQLAACDINGDGKVSTADYVALWNQLKR